MIWIVSIKLQFYWHCGYESDQSQMSDYIMSSSFVDECHWECLTKLCEEERVPAYIYDDNLAEFFLKREIF